MITFLATTSSGWSEEFEAWSWEAADVIAKRRGYIEYGLLIKEVPYEDSITNSAC